MHIDKKIIDAMLALPDDKLWQMLKMVLAANGAGTPEKNLDPASIRKLRAVLSKVTEEDLARASILMDAYKSAK